jgi:hypothetical protein
VESSPSFTCHFMVFLGGKANVALISSLALLCAYYRPKSISEFIYLATSPYAYSRPSYPYSRYGGGYGGGMYGGSMYGPRYGYGGGVGMPLGGGYGYGRMGGGMGM